jgi:hypothetical protein
MVNHRIRFVVNSVAYLLTVIFIVDRIKRSDHEFVKKLMDSLRYLLVMTVFECIRYGDLIIFHDNYSVRRVVNGFVLILMFLCVIRAYRQVTHTGNRSVSWCLCFIVKSCIFLVILELFRYSDALLSHIFHDSLNRDTDPEIHIRVEALSKKRLQK